MNTHLQRLVLFAFICAGTLGAQLAANGTAQTALPEKDLARIVSAARKSLATLPNYGVFDDLHFAIQGTTLILRGEASRPVLKSSAERAVKNIEGITKVQNEIEVLPLSANDDRIRTAVYARIYGNPVLQRYTANRGGGARLLSRTARMTGITNDPPLGYHAIHIIVKNGNVNLRGVVDNDSDSTLAQMQANTTPGVFSVENDLYVTANQPK